MPTKKRMGFEKLKNLEMWDLKPNSLKARMWVATTEIMAIARVKLRSAEGARKKGIIPCSPFMPIEPTPGKSPSQLAVVTIMKMVPMRGRYRSDLWRSPSTESIRPKRFSRPISTMLWPEEGTRAIFLFSIVPRIRRSPVTIIPSRRLLVKGKTTECISDSALSDMWIPLSIRPIL